MKKPLARRIGRWLGRIALGIVVLLVGLFLLVSLSLNLPPVRELVRERANAELETALMGKITVERLGELGYRGIGGVDATVTDPKGERVVVVRGLAVDVFWPRIVWSLLTDDGFIAIGIDAVRLDHAELFVRDDGSGGPTLASAFEPRPSPPTPGPPTEVRIRIASVRSAHAWVHGHLGDGPVIDGDLRNLRASLESDAKGTRLALDGVTLAFRALPEKVDPTGKLAGRLDLPSASGPRGSGRFDGTIAGAAFHAEGGWDGVNLRARVRAPDISGGTSRRIGLDIRDRTSLAVSADGLWPDVRFDAELAGPAVYVGVRGKAHVAEETQVSAVVDASRVDLERLVPNAPSSLLAVHAELGMRVPPSGELAGDYRLNVPSGRIQALATPPLETSGRVKTSRDGELRIAGEATVQETDAPTEVAYTVRAKEGGVSAHVEVDGRFRNPPRLAAFGVRASGTLRASADFDSKTSVVDAEARLRFTSVLHEAVRVHALALNAKVRGSVSDPTLAVDLTAGPVDAAGRRFSDVAATVSGKPSRLAVHALAKSSAPRRIEVETALSLAQGTELDGLRVTLFGDEESLELRAAKVVAADGALRVDRFAVRGAGSADGNFTMNGQRQRVELSASELDLGRIARLAGVRVPFEQATVSADISLARRPGALEGHARARATQVKMGKLDPAGAAFDLAFTPEDVSGTVDADFGEGGRFHVELERFEPPREPWTLARFANQPGSLVARGDLRLAGFLPLIEAMGLPIQRLAGTATFDVSASGGSAGGGPRVEMRLETKNLKIVEKRVRSEPVRTAAQARELEPRALEGVDVKLAFEIEPKERQALLDVELFDPYGTIVKANGETRLPEDWPSTLARAWRTLPLRATLEVPRRPFEIFPAVIRPASAKGIAAVQIQVEGTVLAPTVDGEVVVDRLRVRQGDEPVKIALRTHYDQARGDLSLAAETLGRTVGTLEATWRGDALRLATADVNGRSPIELDVAGELRDFPLDAIPALVDRQIKGPLSGTVRLDGLGKNAKLDVSLDGSKMTIGEVRMERLRADVAASDEHVRVHVVGGDRKGTAELELRTTAAWGDRLVPTTPTEAEGRLTAKAFRLETLNPAVKQFLNEVAGRLDADLTVKLAPGKNALAGQASIRDGVVQVPAAGQRFTDVRADVKIQGDRVYLRNAQARGPTGRLTARATARLDGLALKAAEAHIGIKEREKLPVTLEGAALGDAWGRFAVLYRETDDATEIRVDVPSLHVELAEQGDLEVQSLEDVESIRIGARLADGTFTSLPVQPLEEGGDESESSTPMKVRIRLGDVEIKKGLMLQVKLGGELLMTSDDGKSRMTGRLELKGGKLDVQGKLFDVERGVVTFAGDPSNPNIAATARWDSPAGYSVFADYSGDVENGKITLRSEPPLNQDEITSLLMFGDPEGSVGTGSGNTNSAATAVGVAGDTAAKGINQALSDLTRLDVAARIDTSTGTARPELVFQISPRVATRVTRAIGEPQAGQPPDRTFLTVEFRLTSRWSISGVVGDHGGSGMDVVWRRRY